MAHPIQLLTEAAQTPDTKANIFKKGVALSEGAARKARFNRIWPKLIASGLIVKTPSKKFVTA